MNASHKRRLHTLETVIKPPSVEDLSADARVVLIMLHFQQRVLPDWLRCAEERRANGPRPCPPDSPASSELRARWQRVLDQVIDANARFGELFTQGRVQGIVEHLGAVGLWHEPWPPAPDAVKIIERLCELEAEFEANRKPAGET